MKFGVVVFPGSNCDHDAYHAAKHVLGQPTVYLWHKDEDLQGCDVVILPGGFSYGDYLRTGAIARFSPIMKSVVRFAEGGGKVLGICNGFQILLESGLLPGAMLRNKGLKFICRPQHIRVETTDTPFTRACESGRVLSVPIAHHDGNYFADDETLARLKAEDRVVFRYCDADGTVGAASNPNGSADHIAGICNAGRNVVGLMPHPERAVEALTGSDDGRRIFASLL
ncbi:MAG: phosphoribosylformylglycinamidine synthase subunit PurQ [Acidobacteria bacterium]|nr:phosphoribosylformylglycinamidine synthase subunit PurQ [Acidobacteriota bacterium]